MNMTQPLQRRIAAGIIALYLIIMPALSCSSGGLATSTIGTVKRGNIEATISINGRLDMPRELKLHFLTPGVIEKIFVCDGDEVKAGKLLAKLDDTSQKQAVGQAQYNVQLAMNELVEKVYSSIMGYPYNYPSAGILLRFEAAQKEISNAQELLKNGSCREAMTQLRLAIHDLHFCQELLQPPREIAPEDYPNIFVAIDRLKTDINLLEQDTETKLSAQTMLDKGLYDAAVLRLATVAERLIETHVIINGVTGIIRSYFPIYPDTSTSLDISKQAQDSLKQVQKLLEQDDIDTIQTAEKLNIALHDLQVSNDILENSEVIFKHGLNLKAMRLNNLNLEKAEKSLQSAKTELMKTEIIAPFDGIVVEIGLKENDVISAVDYNTKTVVHLVDTSTVEMVATVDETDIGKIAVGQTAIITTDTIPGEKFAGTVSFVSPYGSMSLGPATFTVKIKVDNTGKLLKRGVSVVATIATDSTDNALLVPANAIKGINGNYRVDVVKTVKNGKISDTEERVVTIGVRNKEFIEITSGLNEGDMVLVHTLHR